jgi:3alpha(or 20beta)-hydroxysteroid dehydrogenase
MHRHGSTVAIVTGGARGMGAAHVRRLTAEGARVVVADLLDDDGSALAAEIGAAALFVHHDVSSAASWAAAVGVAEEHFGPVNALVNNAGIVAFDGITTTTEEGYRRIVEVNQTGVFLGMSAVLDPMRRQGHGSIVNISSTAGMVGYTHGFAYVASKWAVRGMTKAAALELAPLGIRVNSVHPGTILTPMSAGYDGAVADAVVAKIPVQRLGHVDEVAALVAYLLSDEAGFTTGTEHVIDGGVTAGDFRL